MSLPQITTDPEVLGGTPVFAGTRVPVRFLFEHLEAGDPLSVFLRNFPTVDRERAVAVLEKARAAAADGKVRRVEHAHLDRTLLHEL